MKNFSLSLSSSHFSGLSLSSEAKCSNGREDGCELLLSLMSMSGSISRSMLDSMLRLAVASTLMSHIQIPARG